MFPMHLRQQYHYGSESIIILNEYDAVFTASDG